MWISFEEQNHKRFNKLSGLTKKFVILSILMVLGFQIFWAASASISDFNGTYSGGEAIANYIKTNKLEDKKIYATSFWSTTVLPYFDKNIFANHNNGEKPAFWLWRLNNKRIEDLETILNAYSEQEAGGAYGGSMVVSEQGKILAESKIGKPSILFYQYYPGQQF
jgi:hypothetical protein